MPNKSVDTEFVILENIYDSSGQEVPLRQRDLARIAGASLGMTNAILKRLAKRGWISIKKLNSRNIQYVITLEGINEILHRSYRYFKRTIRNVVYHKDRIDEAVLAAKSNNFIAVLLIGASDLEFILEHACQYYGVSFLKAARSDTVSHIPEENILKVYSENIPSPEKPAVSAPVRDAPGRRNVLYLSSVLLGSAEKPARIMTSDPRKP
ncbi:MAG: MarR family transcriptional regulator [Spirochaetaceae bacterium]|jgi:DNA-binding MarR family transcriptional regulator|nr:MarR family transcriptional regulator [Spirochaetaceae bacterium]